MNSMPKGSIHLPQVRSLKEPSTSEETGPASGQSLYNRVENLFFIMNEIKHLFEVPPNFYKYTEADETIDAILRHQLPTQELWNK